MKANESRFSANHPPQKEMINLFRCKHGVLLSEIILKLLQTLLGILPIRRLYVPDFSKFRDFKTR